MIDNPRIEYDGTVDEKGLEQNDPKVEFDPRNIFLLTTFMMHFADPSTPYTAG